MAVLARRRRPARTSASPVLGAAPASIVFDDVSLAFDEHVVLEHLSFEVPRGAMRILLGSSGAGKSIVLKLILGLLRPDSGRIFVNGQRIDGLDERELLRVRGDIGMLFQENALFDSLTVAENVGYRLYDAAIMPREQVRARIEEVLGFISLSECIDRFPATLSGGQRRRVAIARAIAAMPSLVLLDDPTTGLDPINAASVDDEIVKLRDLRHVTSLVATHQIRDAHYIAMHEARVAGQKVCIALTPDQAGRARFLLLRDGRIQFEGTTAELLASGDPFLQHFMYRTLPPW